MTVLLQYIYVMTRDTLLIMKLLVRHSKETNLLTAATCGNIPMLKYLVDQGAGVNQTFTTGHEASFHGHVECINILRESGAKAHIKDLWGNNPLHMAAQSGSFDALKTVLQVDFSLINIHNIHNIMGGQSYTWLSGKIQHQRLSQN